MVLYYDLPVYKVGNELYLKFVLARRTLPRSERYTIGQELDRAMVDVLVLVYRINSTRDKVPLIARARQLVVEIQVRTHVLRDIRALSIGHFTELFDLSENLAKQLASWQKFSQKQTISDANVPSGSDGRPESAGSRSGVEFLGAFVKPFRTYAASRSLRRIRAHLHLVAPQMNARRAQAVVNSSLGVLSHYDSYNERTVLTAKCGLSRFGSVSNDALRFYPDAADWAIYRLKSGGKKCRGI